MSGLDHTIANLGDGQTLLVVFAVAVLLGLRHATDPDHLAAVSTLIAAEPTDGKRRARRLGLAWGLGHATTLVLFGLPVVLFRSYLPEAVQQAAEALVGVLIIALALRLLVRWRRGRFHAHLHRHGPVEHRHLHPHEPEAAEAHEHAEAHAHEHVTDAQLGRSPLQAYGIGLVHGMGGSAGVGVLLLAGIPDHGEAIAALVLFALAAAASMAALSSGFGYALTRGPVLRHVFALTPVLGVVALLFGTWYLLGALDAMPYPL
jgi:ABC-type nickel/cobalt efflux system permease component RcnA